MTTLEKNGLERLYTIRYAKGGYQKVYQFYAITEGDIIYSTHEFLEKEKPWAIISLEYQIANYE